MSNSLRRQLAMLLVPVMVLAGFAWAVGANAPPATQPAAIHPDGPPDADGVYVLTRPEVKLDETAAAYAKMKPVAYDPPADRWANLQHTRKLLEGGGELRVVMLGDSIVNDTGRSNWSFHLREQLPKAKIVKYTVVRGSTGCWWYREPGRVQRYVLDFNPNLVLIGGISQKDDVDAVRDVLHQIRAKSDAEILLTTGPFGPTDPNDDKQWEAITHPPESAYAPRLVTLAKDERAGFLDLQRAWGEYVRASGRPVTDFKRDAIHANREGEQILGRILIKYFTP